MFMRMTALLSTGLLWSSLVLSSEIPILGRDIDGNQIDVPIKSKLLKNKLNKLIAGTNQEVLPLLNDQDSPIPDNLSHIEVGGSLIGSLGLGNLIKGSAEARIILLYKKQTEEEQK